MNLQNAKSVYREIEIQGATPLQLVVALYDVVLQDIRRAMEAQKQNDVEARTTHVKHCLMAIGQLQGRLDFERGGEVAKNLDQFYSTVRGKLLEASIKSSVEIFSAIAGIVIPVRSAWNEAANEQLTQSHHESARSDVPHPPPVAVDEAAMQSSWTA